MHWTTLRRPLNPQCGRADELADRRFDNAEASGRLAEMARAIGEQEENLDELRKQEETLTKEGAGLNAGWRAMWDKAPFEPLAPDAMLEWLETRSELLETIERRAEATGVLEIQRKEEREAKESLLTELTALGIDRAALENDALPVILERADGVRHEYDSVAQSKAQLEENLQDAATNIERRRRELARANKAWSKWEGQWSTALTDLGLATDLGPDAVAAQIDVIDQMREKVGGINDLRHQRIDKINRDIVDFETVVNEVVQELAEDLSDTAADDVVLEIEKRLTEAQRICDLQASKREEVEGIEKNVGALEEGRREARELVNHLKESAGTDKIDVLKSAIEKSDALRALQGKLATTLTTLEQEGDGLAVNELVEECAAIDVDQIAAREETIAAEVKALHDQLTTAVETRSQAREAFQAIGGDDAAARAEAARQEALAEIRQVAERYVRVRTSAMLLQWAINRYRREKQAPLLKRAGELFATVTGGSFSDLRVDYDDQDQVHLTGLRPDGEVVRVPGMSTGTADQLYLRYVSLP